jgi:hypothetical protein
MRTNSTHVPLHWVSLIIGAMALLSPLGLSACSNVQIEWVNIVQFHGIQYVASTTTLGRAPVDADIGPVSATVQFKLADNVHDPSYHLKDGDAAFLDAGTPVKRASIWAAGCFGEARQPLPSLSPVEV